ncbi:ATP-binding protein [Goodfellowiella coeruleoviolacea]|nr:ATP-binding protein [Goodfellowiella coeruleoviolacea]
MSRPQKPRRDEARPSAPGSTRLAPASPADATTTHLTFGSEADAASRARQVLTEVLAGLSVPAPALENARLVITELVANALIHGTVPFDVEITTWPGAALVTVADTNPTLPELRRAPSTEPHGRGLVIVDALADDWGVSGSASGGKTVWARLVWPVEG